MEDRSSGRRPDATEVAALWERGGDLTQDAEVGGWLRSRGLDPCRVQDLNLARVLPAWPLPAWARSGAGWWDETGHRLLLPLHGRAGLESVRVRCVRVEARPAKSLAPVGFSLGGLVLADPLGSLLLTGAKLGDGEPCEPYVKEVGLVICEGDVDYLTWGTRWSDACQYAPAVIGVVSGSWTPELAARVPDGTPVAVRVHADQAGRTYAEQVVESLALRCDVRVLEELK